MRASKPAESGDESEASTPTVPIVVAEPGPASGLAASGGQPSPTAASLLASVDSDKLMHGLVERLLDGMPRYTPEAISTMAGVDREVSKKLWRAMGLADVPETDTAFTELDLKALERAKGLLGHDEIEMHLIVQLARALGLATARIADSIVDFTLDRLVVDMAPPAIAAPGADGQAPPAVGSCGDVPPAGKDVTADLPLIEMLLGELDELVVYLLHRHLVDATARRLATVDGGTSSDMVVGFADLVGYTALSQELPDSEIVGMVDRFEALASNEVVGSGGRIIKMIGDEVMFSAGEAAGPEIALRLAEAFDAPDLPMVRVGLASGSVVSRSGDLYGPVVNLAARATAIAHPGTVVVGPSLRDRLVEDDRYQLRRLRPRRLKGIGFVELSALRRARGRPAEG